jgi:hydrogenase nickel incorporation protein HypA/HybF
MHEFSVMSQVVDSILEEAKKHEATKVESVDIELGEYTMLGEEQLRFAFQVLSKDTILAHASLNIRQVKGMVRCACGYEGRVQVGDDTLHKIAPILECPKCKGAAQITEGRECLVRNIRLVVPDV